MIRGLIPVVAVAAAGCLEVEQPNKPPTASVTVMAGGMAVPMLPAAPMGTTGPAYMLMGAPQTVTLQGAGMDPDGTIASYQWWRTDVSKAMRNPPMMMMMPAGGTGAAGMAAAGTGGMGAAGMPAGGMGAGGMPAPPPPPFTGDPPEKTASIQVTLPVVGNYRYSLWVIDDGGLASAPASVTLVVR
jgi:hypothetical protein